MKDKVVLPDEYVFEYHLSKEENDQKYKDYENRANEAINYIDKIIKQKGTKRD